MNKIVKYFSDITDWNLALHIWDDENIVFKNRKNLVLKLNKKTQDFIFMNQIHSWISVIVWEWERWVWTQKIDENLSCDSIVTKEKWIVLSVLVADCVPILFYDEMNWVIWVAHAGWKWTSERIVENTIKNMLNIWANINNVKVIIWPCISKNSYEVWQDVWCHFRQEVKTELLDWKQYLDLTRQNYLDLLDLGVKDCNIEIINIDTFTDNDYYSARRDWFNKWRFGWFIYIK